MFRCRPRLPNPTGKLHPGMFVQVGVELGRQTDRVITLPASAIDYAPYGDSVFVITDIKDRRRQDLPRSAAAVRESSKDRAETRWRWFPGLNAGDEIVSSGVFKLRNGAAVQVNNKVQPGNNPRSQAARTANEVDGFIR